jgi:hypothetical protein
MAGNATIPVVDLSDGSVAGQYDHPARVVATQGSVPLADPAGRVTDAAPGNLTAMTVTLTNHPDGIQERLAADLSGTGLTGTYNSSTGVLTISGSASSAVYTTALRRLTYRDDSRTPDTSDRLIRVVVSDGVNSSVSRTCTVSVAPPLFLPPVNYPVGTAPLGITSADLNGDGIPDLVVANSGDTTVSVLLGNGDGTFSPAVNYFSGSAPDHIVVADFNGDGIPDLAVTNAGDGTVSVLLGNGDGTFQPPAVYPVGPGAAGIAAGDFNRDGVLDLVVANFASNTLSVLLGNGDGSFQEASTLTVGLHPRTVRVADLNGDGSPDLVCCNFDSDTVSVLLGNGDGTFQDPVFYPVGHHPACLQCADFNRDGNLDVVVENREGRSVSVLLGTGDGTLVTGGLDISFGLLNCGYASPLLNNGTLDLATATFDANAVGVFPGNGDGTFQRPLGFPVGTNPISLTGGDFNGDGYFDLAVSNHGSNDVSVLINAGPGGGGGLAPSGGAAGGSRGHHPAPGRRAGHIGSHPGVTGPDHTPAQPASGDLARWTDASRVLLLSPEVYASRSPSLPSTGRAAAEKARGEGDPSILVTGAGDSPLMATKHFEDRKYQDEPALVGSNPSDLLFGSLEDHRHLLAAGLWWSPVV